MAALSNIYCFTQGAIVVFDKHGQQAPELQVGWPALWAKHAESLGYNVDGQVITLVGTEKIRLIKMPEGDYNWEILR